MVTREDVESFLLRMELEVEEASFRGAWTPDETGDFDSGIVWMEICHASARARPSSLSGMPR